MLKYGVKVRDGFNECPNKEATICERADAARCKVQMLAWMRSVREIDADIETHVLSAMRACSSSWRIVQHNPNLIYGVGQCKRVHAQFQPSEFSAMTGAEICCVRMLRP